MCLQYCTSCSYPHIEISHLPGISEEDFKKFSEYASLPKDLKYVQPPVKPSMFFAVYASLCIVWLARPSTNHPVA